MYSEYFSEPFERKLEICPFTPKYLSVYFLRIRMFSYNHGTVIKIRWLTSIQQYLIHNTCSNLVGCQNNKLSVCLPQSRSQSGASCILHSSRVSFFNPGQFIGFCSWSWQFWRARASYFVKCFSVWVCPVLPCVRFRFCGFGRDVLESFSVRHTKRHPASVSQREWGELWALG